MTHSKKKEKEKSPCSLESSVWSQVQSQCQVGEEWWESTQRWKKTPGGTTWGMRVSWDSCAGSLGVARGSVARTGRELLIRGRRQRLCVSGVKGQRLCVCQGHGDRLHALLERLILMCPALQGTKPCSMGSAFQKDISTSKAGLDLASPWSSTWPYCT